MEKTTCCNLGGTGKTNKIVNIKTLLSPTVKIKIQNSGNIYYYITIGTSGIVLYLYQSNQIYWIGNLHEDTV